MGYSNPTPIQEKAIPPLLEHKDVLGCAQTGTGKTAAFCLPLLHHMSKSQKGTGRSPRALILTPTRELAAQIGQSLKDYSAKLPIKSTVIFGGVNEKPQIRIMKEGVDVLVATPGRLLDLAGRGFIGFDKIDFFVLDEADRMLDMGFVHDVQRVIDLLPKKRQNLLFSATMPAAIKKLSKKILYQPVRIEVSPPSSTVERIVQSIMFVSKANKPKLLSKIIKEKNIERAIVFTRTKHGANKLVKQLDRSEISSAAIHGNKSQGARTRALDGFKKGEISILVATDIASRGIDVEGISHVFNYELPNIPETYVHRIGRTARAGHDGMAISFADSAEAVYVKPIEKEIGKPIPIDQSHEFHDSEAEKFSKSPELAPKKPPRKVHRKSQGRSGKNRSNKNVGGKPSSSNRSPKNRSQAGRSRRKPSTTSKT